MKTAILAVCALEDMEKTLWETSASHLVSLINEPMMPQTPSFIERPNHLKLSMNDIDSPVTGAILPSMAHVEQLIDFVKGWDQAHPLVIHCWAGISRSTAAAFITLCTLNPTLEERRLADLLRQKSPSATPNGRLVACADQLLQRSGRMVEAIKAIGRGETASLGPPFSIRAVFDEEAL